MNANPDLAILTNARAAAQHSMVGYGELLLEAARRTGARVAEWRGDIPAVTHVNGAGRVQTVTEHQNERYWRLTEAFREKTDVSIILNTAFNVNEPVAYRPEEAIACFVRRNMDVPVLGEWVVRSV